MKQSIGRVLVETTVRKTLREICQDPKRSIRNLVDLAREFSVGDFQQLLFETAGSLLEDETSSYYHLVQETVDAFDWDRLVCLGLNIGYNGCIQGARQIRSLEAAEHFNIPWCVSLELEEELFSSSFEQYRQLILQGLELGIYCWQIHTDQISDQLLQLIRLFPDCAFALFCPSSCLYPMLPYGAEAIRHLMFVPTCSSREELTFCRNVCELLKKKKIPYGILIKYDENTLPVLTGTAFLTSLTELSPVLTFFAPTSFLSDEAREASYARIHKLRMEAEYPTIFLDLMEDNYRIDSIISSESCSAGFTKTGQLFSQNGITTDRESCFLHHSLKEILKTAFPKTED